MTTISSRPRHPGAALTLALALTLGLAACGGGGGTEEQPPSASAALTAAQPGELAAFVQARLRRPL